MGNGKAHATATVVATAASAPDVAHAASTTGKLGDMKTHATATGATAASIMGRLGDVLRGNSSSHGGGSSFAEELLLAASACSETGTKRTSYGGGDWSSSPSLANRLLSQLQNMQQEDTEEGGGGGASDRRLPRLHAPSSTGAPGEHVLQVGAGGRLHTVILVSMVFFSCAHGDWGVGPLAWGVGVP